MIRKTSERDFESIYEIINDAATAYKGHIPEDCWHEPYMPREELSKQICDGVEFSCFDENGIISGVMGIQNKGDVNLIRHAYVRTNERKKGIGGMLLQSLVRDSQKPILIGTWKAAEWAISFYIKHGFSLVTEDEKNILLPKYWKISRRQIETSVVLAGRRFVNATNKEVN